MPITEIIESEDGGYILCGYSANTLNDMFDNYNIFYATTDQYGNLTSINDDLINNFPGLTLYQNYPNPFNPSTTIEYQLPQSGIVSLKIYDLLGREIAELINEYKSAGRHKKQFDGGKYNLSSGVYFYSLSVDSFIESKVFTFFK